MTHALIPRSFFRDFFDLGRDFDAFLAPVADRGSFTPTIDGYVEDGTLHVRCDLPGLDPKDVDVTLENGVLTVRGERKSDTDRKDGYREVRYGRFERSMRVPRGVDPESIEATYTNGVLALRVPLPAEVTARKVPIQIADSSSRQAA